MIMIVLTRLMGTLRCWFILCTPASGVVSMVIGKAKGACSAAEVLCECSILIMFCVPAELSVSGGGGAVLIPRYGLWR